MYAGDEHLAADDDAFGPFDDEYDDEYDEDDEDDEHDPYRDDVEADAHVLAMAGYGPDEYYETGAY